MDMDKWELERQAQHEATYKRYRELYDGIAKHLDGWKVIERDNPNGIERHDLLRLSDGTRQIDLTIDSHNKKVHVSGNWPQFGANKPFTSPRDVGMEPPSMSMSLSKPHEQMAKDIKRRFITLYLATWEALQAHIDSRNEYDTRKKANWDVVCIYPVVKPWAHHGDPRASLEVVGGYGEVLMESADSVKIELRSVPLPLAHEILELLTRAWRKT